MTDMKAINPAAIETYAGQINSGVDAIVQGLNDLCAHITNVNYGGRNAYAFKSDSSRVANSLSTKIHEALTQLARQVAQATSDLSGSLGGSGIVINLKDNKFTPASPGENSDRGVASMSGLKTLASQVETAFAAIAAGIAKVADMPPNSPGRVDGRPSQPRRGTHQRVRRDVEGQLHHHAGQPDQVHPIPDELARRAMTAPPSPPRGADRTATSPHRVIHRRGALAHGRSRRGTAHETRGGSDG